MTETPATDIVKWYTRARKFPQLIGRTPDGMRLWGGPYTITQACGFGLVMFVGLNTMSLWASFGPVGNFVVLGTVAVGVVFGLGRIPVGSRSPLSVAAGAWKAVASPRYGRLAGRSVRIRRPHRVRHTVLIQLAPLAEPSRIPAPELSSADPGGGWTRRWISIRRRRAGHPAPAPVGPVSAPAAAPGSAVAPASAPGSAAPASARLDEPVAVLTGIQVLLAASAAPHRSETSR